MSNLVDDPKFKADIVFGYTALSQLLDNFDKGRMQLFEWDIGEQQMVQVDDEPASKMIADLNALRSTLQSLMVGVPIDQVRR